VSEVAITFISLSGRYCLLVDGTTIPITNMFNDEREPIEDYRDFFVFVAGSDDRGWITVFRKDLDENFQGVLKS
jgi:hypothetical protein